MKLRMLYLMLLIGGLSCLAFLADERWMLPCPLHRWTGWECPFCGGQRMLAALLRADWCPAFAYNPFLFCSLPLVGIGLLRYFFPSFSFWKAPFFTKLYTDRTFFLYLLAALLWGILRNLYLCE
ncbi:MAG: DUF2752 domain-containing protein [Bacteroides sp.]|nr:DUF2752 domain-containing protein [Bacteroides sp.]